MKSNVHKDDVVYITTEAVTKTTAMPKIVLKKTQNKMVSDSFWNLKSLVWAKFSNVFEQKKSKNY